MRELKITLERHREDGHRLTYYSIRDKDDCMIWCMRPETYHRLKVAIKRFDKFLDKIMKSKGVKHETDKRI